MAVVGAGRRHCIGETGYQLDGSHQALRIVLSKYLAEGLQNWLKTFPDAFFTKLGGLYGNDTSNGKRPQYYGSFINEYVYHPIEHGYLEQEPNKLNIDDDGKRKAKFCQRLNDEERTMLIHQLGRLQGRMEMRPDAKHFRAAASRQKAISVAPFLFEEMNRIID